MRRKEKLVVKYPYRKPGGVIPVKQELAVAEVAEYTEDPVPQGALTSETDAVPEDVPSAPKAGYEQPVAGQFPLEIVFAPNPGVVEGLNYAIGEKVKEGKTNATGPPEKAGMVGTYTEPSPLSLDEGGVPPKTGGDQSGGSETQTLTTKRYLGQPLYRPEKTFQRDPNKPLYRPDPPLTEFEAGEEQRRPESNPATVDLPAISSEAVDFAADVDEVYFENLPLFVEPWNVRLMMECIAFAGGRRGAGEPGGGDGQGEPEIRFGPPDIVKKITCERLEGDRADDGSGGRATRHFVKIKLQSDTVLDYVHGPGQGEWSMVSEVNNPGISMPGAGRGAGRGGAGTPKLPGNLHVPGAPGRILLAHGDPHGEATGRGIVLLAPTGGVQNRRVQAALRALHRHNRGERPERGRNLRQVHVERSVDSL